MTNKEIDRRLRLYADLAKLGIAHEDCVALRRISMTLHRWHELECGNSNNYASYCVVRGYKTGKVFEHDEEGDSYMETHYHQGDAKARYHRIADRERGAQRRLAKIMARYPGFQAYVQGDPRGCALYILRPGDVPEGKDVGSCYSRGLAVW